MLAWGLIDIDTSFESIKVSFDLLGTAKCVDLNFSHVL